MTNILLLGAGFSKNWGGLLAKEFFEELIGDPMIREDAPSKAVLWRYPNNFEQALEHVQKTSIAEPTVENINRLHRFEGAIRRLFGKMNDIFKGKEFFLRDAEGRRDGSTTPNEFLSRFNKIFTLNQDLLLEIHHFGHPEFMQDSWRGGCLPGLVSNKSQDNPKQFADGTWIVHGSLDVADIYQPYYKLHGSINWAGDEMMIMGAGKAASISANKLLAAYQNVFRGTLSAPNTRLTVIGYSFADDHINEAIKVAVKECDLKIFVIDPQWSGIDNKFDAAFRDWFTQAVIGSSRDLLYLLRDESMDRQRLRGFLSGK
ncbi:MAG: SIR2 family protein [Pseudomonadota bacterium]